MAGKKITNIDAYGSQDNEKALKDLYECVKNSGTYATPVYATGDSRRIELEQLISIINANIDTSFVKLFVGKSNGDTIELDKVNSLSLSSDATFTLPTSTSANNGSIIIIRHQGGYNATITGYSGDDIILKSFNDIIFFASVFDGTNYFWQLISKSIKGINSLNGLSSPNQIFSVGTSGTAPNFNSAGAIHTFNLPYSGTTGVTMGGLSKTDYDAFFAKQDALGYTAENSENKTDTVVGNESSTSKYLSVKGYYDYLIGLTWLTNSIFGTFISGLTAKTTPADADTTVISDSADSNKAKKLTFANLITYIISKILPSLTTNYHTKWDGTKLVNSLIQDQGTYLNIGANMYLASSASPIGSNLLYLTDYNNTNKNLFRVDAFGTASQFVLAHSYGGASTCTFTNYNLVDWSYNFMVAGFGKYNHSLFAQCTNGQQNAFGVYNTNNDVYVFRVTDTGVIQIKAVNATATTTIAEFLDNSGNQKGKFTNGGLIIGSGTRNSSAIVHFESTSLGVKLPKLPTASDITANSTNESMFWYNDTDNVLKYNTDTETKTVATGADYVLAFQKTGTLAYEVLDPTQGFIIPYAMNLKEISVILESSSCSASESLIFDIRKLSVGIGLTGANSQYTLGAGSSITTISLASGGILASKYYRSAVTTGLNIAVSAGDVIFVESNNFAFWSVTGVKVMLRFN